MCFNLSRATANEFLKFLGPLAIDVQTTRDTCEKCISVSFYARTFFTIWSSIIRRFQAFTA